MSRHSKASHRRFKLPHTLVLMFWVLLGVYLLTWLLPSGQFDRQTVMVDGSPREVTVPGTYKALDVPPPRPEILLLAPIRGFSSAAPIIAFLLVVGGAFGIIQATGAMDHGISSLSRRLAAHPRWRMALIPLFMTLFSVGGAVFGMSEETIPFVSLFIPLSIRLGYDALVGTAIPFLGAAAGFAAAFFNPFTVGIAQSLAGLPLYSGLSYRLVVWVSGTLVMIVYVMSYARKIHRNPELSPVRDLDGFWSHPETGTDGPCPSSRRNALILLSLGLGILLLVWGVLVHHWYMEAIAALFLGLGIICGLLGRLDGNTMAQAFVNGAKDMVGVAWIIAAARGILWIAQEGAIMDTLLHQAAGLISLFPRLLTAQAMFLVQSLINVFIHSGSAQAALTMPVMAPLSDLVGITRQTAVLAFQLCEFVLPILPTSGVTMGILGVARIPWGTWARWFAPLLGWLLLLSSLLLVYPVLSAWA